MTLLRTLLDVPEQLLAAHDRLRADGLALITVVNARSAIEARVWLGQWAKTRGRTLITAAEADVDVALAAYRMRFPAGLDAPQPARAAPLLRLPGPVQAVLPVAERIARQRPDIAVVLTCGIGDLVETLLDTLVPQALVSKALQGLVPIDEAERRVMETVTKARKLPLLRGPSEGILFYMLEARVETRGRFAPNLRLPGVAKRSYEVDLVCSDARLVVEIDGPEHDAARRRRMDEDKQRDLESQGFKVARFANATVIHDPVAVWRDIAAMLPPATQRTDA